ncbi:LuxR family transcriptional regulator [Thalassobius vesicularis]|uniref:LuxR family transcriptional regulator n=1 Tax=Thalassobius vesicularis TaxID=1294297 RepID=A0A4S3MC15_9RHOB|nr:autoinducer binding domain-containing protein [Thalassobius vesicularis]THD75801.1 LuxR family transcriptional regulator [Thalassobius vesicularis]
MTLLTQIDDAEAIVVLNRIAAAPSVECAWTLTVEALARFGFERVNYGYTRYRLGRSIGHPDDAFFLSTHSLDQVKAFHTSGLYMRSADYRWVRENVGACPWDWTRKERAAGRLSAEECEAMDALGAARQRAGYSISFPDGAPRSKGAMGMGCARGVTQEQLDAHWATCGERITAIATMAHFKLSQLPLPVPGLDLSERQHEILGWIADGKTLQDVCVLTGLSLSAVEKYLRRARDELGVETTVQAVAKVAFLNQLYIHASSV